MFKQIFLAGMLAGVSAWAQDGTTSAQLTERGISQFKRRYFADAIVTFQNAVDLDPKNVVALRGSAEAHFQAAGMSKDPIYRNKMLDEAVRWDQRLIEVNPQEPRSE